MKRLTTKTKAEPADNRAATVPEPTRRACLGTTAAACLWLSAPGLATAQSPQSDGAPPLAQDIYFYRGAALPAFFSDIGADYSRIVDAWQSAAPRLGFVWQQAELAQLDRLPSRSVLILASAVALDDAERVALMRFAQRGGSLLATWATAARDGKGQWRGYDLLDQQFGAKVTSEFADTDTDWFLIPLGETPVTFELPAGLRIPLAHLTAKPLRARAEQPVARYGTWARQAAPNSVAQDAVSILERGNSRRAWIGFPESAWTGAQSTVEVLLRDTLNWLRRVPAVGKAAWPAPYRAAILLEMDTEDKFDNSERFAQHLDERQFTGTFYCVTSVMQKFPDVTRRLAQRHEIAYHGDVHTPFKGDSLPAQEARVIRMVAAARTVLPADVKPTGFRAPLELFDHGTEIAIRRYGLKHHAADGNIVEHALPAFSVSEPSLPNDERLVELPRAWYDDINLLEKGTSREGFGKLFNTMVADTLSMRSLGLLSIHTQNYGRDSPLTVQIPALLDTIHQQRQAIWVATGGQIERWWHNRDRISHRVSAVDKDSMTLQLTAAKAIDKGVRFNLYPPAANTQVTLQHSDAAGIDVIRETDQHWQLVLPALRPGQYTLELAFRPAPSAPGRR